MYCKNLSVTQLVSYQHLIILPVINPQMNSLLESRDANATTKTPIENQHTYNENMNVFHKKDMS